MPVIRAHFAILISAKAEGFRRPVGRGESTDSCANINNTTLAGMPAISFALLPRAGVCVIRRRAGGSAVDPRLSRGAGAAFANCLGVSICNVDRVRQAAG